jgi:hypothetical protein
MSFDKHMEQWYPEDEDFVPDAYCEECGIGLCYETDFVITNGKHCWCSDSCALAFFHIEEV